MIRKSIKRQDTVKAKELEPTLPRASLFIWIICAGLLALLIWAWLFKLEEVSTGTGKVIPSSKEQVIQSLEGGILTKLYVHEGEIIEKGSANYLYENPKDKYVASLFGDVNEIEIDGKSKLVYPHQLEIVEQSTVEVEVLQSFFRGNHFLVEAVFQNTILYFESHSSLEKGAKVFLQVKK